VTSDDLRGIRDGQQVKVAGLVARPLQHPLANAYFITLEDEHGFIPLIIWPNVYEKYRDKLREPLLLVEGVVSRREGTLNVVVSRASVPRLERIPTGDTRLATEFVKLPRPMFR
jgi:aspartyl-tRNA synthetase